jgi:hypothetical protein
MVEKRKGTDVLTVPFVLGFRHHTRMWSAIMSHFRRSVVSRETGHPEKKHRFPLEESSTKSTPKGSFGRE